MPGTENRIDQRMPLEPNTGSLLPSTSKLQVLHAERRSTPKTGGDAVDKGKQ